MLIAASEYFAKKVDGTIIVFKINIGIPEPDPLSNGADYRCKVEIPELSFNEYSYGIDAVQSLCLVAHCIKYALEPLMLSGWKFYLSQDLESELDFMSAFLPTHVI